MGIGIEIGSEAYISIVVRIRTSTIVVVIYINKFSFALIILS